MSLPNALLGIILTSASVPLAYSQSTPSPGHGAETSAFRSTLDRYCVGCHNEQLKTAGLMLDRMDLEDVGAAPQRWERVITKLTLRQMPPVGMPRPDDEFYDSFVSYLAGKLDHAARARPNPGKMVTAHRLNRTEYTNAVRDLLGIEIDGASMLPPDNSGGFDNLGDLLSVSEVLMENYMSAASRISRVAVGDPTIQADTLEYKIDPKLLQNGRMNEDLPFGTRGGLAVRHNFPVDGEYIMNIRLLKTSGSALTIGINEPHRLDVRIDGNRVKLFTVGGENVGLGLANGGADKVPPDFSQAQYERTADSKLEIRFPMKAGTRTVQVAFLDDTFAWEGEIPAPNYENWTKARLGDDYERAWRDPWVSSVLITGPLNVVKGPGDSASRDRIFTCYPSKTPEEKLCARDILTNLTRLAHRHPAAEGDVNSLLGLYEKGRRETGTFDGGIQMALEGLLVSTKFLFRIERDPPGVQENNVYPISDLELASRLSFFLWSSIPDDELLKVAEEGRLRVPEVLQRQVKRMLKDNRSKTLVSDFADQWLLLRNLPKLNKNQDIFPDFDETLRQNLYTEVQLFLGSIFRDDHSILDFFQADYTYLNERLARHYGVENVYGNRFRKVHLDDPNQRGLLARSSIMAITTYPNRNSTVLRGKWVLDNILASPPPPPPPNVPTLDATKAPPGQTFSLRERMEKHPANPVCAVCHNQMDPIGFGLENYDAIGKWRTEDEGKPINAAGKLPSGVEFEGPAELQEALLGTPGVIVGAFTQKLLTYALGRPVEYYDMPTVRKIVADSADTNYRFSSIVFGIINSTPFNMRRAGS